MTKYEKDEVDYSHGHQGSHCGKVFSDDKGYCKHFVPQREVVTLGACDLVKGGIKPVYLCTEWQQAKK